MWRLALRKESPSREGPHASGGPPRGGEGEGSERREDRAPASPRGSRARTPGPARDAGHLCAHTGLGVFSCPRLTAAPALLRTRRGEGRGGPTARCPGPAAPARLRGLGTRGPEGTVAVTQRLSGSGQGWPLPPKPPLPPWKPECPLPICPPRGRGTFPGLARERKPSSTGRSVPRG